MELVIMAGGLGSRFGGLKQLAPIDDNGNYIIDYSIYDAIRCGFDKVVFIINEKNYEAFSSSIGKRIENKVKVSYVFQNNENLNIDRVKPLGTGYAVLLVENQVSDRFAVINADDFYGYESFNKLAQNLKNLADDNFCTTIFKLKNTISEFGNVTRGVATINNGYLEKITESEITKRDDKLFSRKLTEENFKEVITDTPVSMNMFGFTKKLFDFLKHDFEIFMKDKSNIESKEFYLPVVVTDAIKNNKIKVSTHFSDSRWLGLTYKNDLESVKENIKKLITDGVYPKSLWN